MPGGCIPSVSFIQYQPEVVESLAGGVGARAWAARAHPTLPSRPCDTVARGCLMMAARGRAWPPGRARNAPPSPGAHHGRQARPRLPLVWNLAAARRTPRSSGQARTGPCLPATGEESTLS